MNQHSDSQQRYDVAQSIYRLLQAVLVLELGLAPEPEPEPEPVLEPEPVRVLELEPEPVRVLELVWHRRQRLG